MTEDTPLATGIAVIKDYVRTLPSAPGVYRMLSEGGDVLYVGKAKNLPKRVISYTQPARLPIRLQRMVAQTRRMEFVTTHTEAEALLLECNLIKQLQPRYNVLLRDDKAFPYIALTRHEFPQLFKHRGTRKLDEATYYGPFASGLAVSETIATLYRVFQLRNCSDSMFETRTRPCLQFHIKRCTAPCVQKVTRAQYAEQVRQTKEFLQGKSSDIQAELGLQMQAAAEGRDYEKAASLRDRIRALTTIQSRQDIHAVGVDDADVIAATQLAGQTCIQVFFFRQGRNYGTRSYFPSHEKDLPVPEVLAPFMGQFYAGRPVPPQILLSEEPAERELFEEALKCEILVPQRGEKRRLVEHALSNAKQALERRMAEGATQVRLLEGVATLFGLDEPPERIEVYDNSHVQGAHAVGAMIVAGPEGFIKKEYRKFTIKDEGAAGDDFAMMREVMRRRFARALEEGKLPDLVLIDGGLGQLSAVTETLAELGISEVPLVAISKGPDRNAGREFFHQNGKDSFQLPENDPVLFYLQRLRDESHRFVIGTHRAKRAKALVSNPLDALPGVGPARKKALLHHFGSAKDVAAAGLSDLENVPGISKALAVKIYEFFRSR
jgi:excinuclease ABC subunit C